MPGLCSTCPHPGGEILTRRMAALSCFKEGQTVLDIGCGDGSTLRLLRSMGIRAFGAETDPGRCDGAAVLPCDGGTLPFATASFDGAVMECALTCLDEPERMLREARRVLRPEGTLAVTDLFSAAEGEGLPTLSGYRSLFARAGFCVYYEEDATEHLIQLFGQLLFDGGQEAVEEALGLSPADRRRIRPGYHLWVLIPDRMREFADRTAGAPLSDVTDLTGSRPKLLAAEPKDIARIITVKTSGSTGDKKRIYFTDADLQKTADFFTPGMAPMIGAGDKVAVFMRGTGIYSIAGLLDIAVRRLGGTAEGFGDPADLSAAAEAARKADCLVMLPGDAAALAALYPELRPKSVLLSADHIPESVARRVIDTWHCALFRHWGMTETGYGGAVTAEPDGPYLLRRDLFAEVIDPLTGKCLPEGSVGEIVITTVGREGMPLLRYRTGDRGRLHRDENGRQALSGLEGRLSDAVRLPDGTNISIHILDEIFYNEPGLVYYEAGLSAEGTLRIGWQGTECAGDGLPAESLPFRLRARLGAAFGGIRATFYPAAFRTGKRSLKTEGDLT